MQCPRCGGWHYGTGSPPPVTTSVSKLVPLDEAKLSLKAVRHQMSLDPYDRDVLPHGSRTWDSRVYGADEEGREVTAAFGRVGGSKEGQTMIASDHVPGWSFYVEDNQGVKGHDHAGDGFYVDRHRAP